MRSQRHLRYTQGIDSRGKCAYEYGTGTPSRLPAKDQYLKTYDKGNRPAQPAGGFNFTATVNTLGPKICSITIGGLVYSGLMTIAWGDATTSTGRALDVLQHTYSTVGVKNITITIAGVPLAKTFTAT